MTQRFPSGPPALGNQGTKAGICRFRNRGPRTIVKGMRKSSTKAKPSQGFTLVEVMIASVVLVMIFLSTLDALQQGFKMIDTARNTTIAGQIIQSEIEDLRLKPWASLTALPATTELDIAQSIGQGLASEEGAALARRFSASRVIADVTDRANNLKRITLTVTWADTSGATHTRSYETLFSHFGLSDYFVAEHGTAP